ncbi:response regulator transcription factor [Gorillibacterium sp. sgz5001074]|uniref:response regulator transcription factor n=1 Tax=Gorillibacterium sp. sgz5001074 TaxID=3446695 RepID=UPI003F67F338
MTQLLIVDDDLHLRELTKLFLKEEGFRLLEAEDGVEALRILESNRVDLAIVDVMMPRMDGWELCREIHRHYEIPVLMLTAKGETADKVKGFQLGADDYLVKPYEPAELAVRVKALLRRYRIASSQSVQVGRLKMDRKTYETTADGETITLPMKEFELLFKLAGMPGKTQAREQLIEEIWGYDFEGNERTLDVHINRLREKFPEDRMGFRIKTIRGIGYKLEECSP